MRTKKSNRVEIHARTQVRLLNEKGPVHLDVARVELVLKDGRRLKPVRTYRLGLGDHICMYRMREKRK